MVFIDLYLIKIRCRCNICIISKIDYDILIANPIRLVGILEKNQDLREFNEVTYLVIGKYIFLNKRINNILKINLI